MVAILTVVLATLKGIESAYPERAQATISELDLFKISALTFKEPDTETFALLACAVDSIKQGGALPAVLNAANEVAVAAFLDRKIQFYQITEAVCETVETLQSAKQAHTLDSIIEFDREARIIANRILKL